MATKLEAFFDALTEQTRRRGGSPSVRNISEVALAVQNVLACYSQVREQAVVPGMSLGLARAIEAMDSAVRPLNTHAGLVSPAPEKITDEALAEAMADAECENNEALWKFLSASERRTWIAAAQAAKKLLNY